MYVTPEGKEVFIIDGHTHFGTVARRTSSISMESSSLTPFMDTTPFKSKRTVLAERKIREIHGR